jgi:acyl-CoA synthetase (NDP forming)
MTGADTVTPRSDLERLAAIGVRIPQSWECADAGEAAGAAGALGGRVALKAGGLLHKSDEGGVVLGLVGENAVHEASLQMLGRLGERALPLVVQEMASGFELLVGAARDPELGVTVTVGLGGTATEVHRDLISEHGPVDAAGAGDMLRRLRSWPLLDGYRGERARDVEAVCHVVVAVSTLMLNDPTIGEVDLNPVLVGAAGDGAVVVDARIMPLAEREPHRPRRTEPRTLNRMMNPRHVAVVGVSDDPDKVGARLYRYLQTHGYAGRLHAVHPAGGAVHGQPRYRSLAEVPGSPDLVCVTVPSRFVLDVARDAVTLKAGGLLVHSSDFAESGSEGRDIQRELASVCAMGDLPLAGPNNMGIVVPHLGLTASISGGLEQELVPGPVALLTSSGALGSCLATRLMGAGVGLSTWVHVGNEADLVLADYLDHVARDDETGAAVLLLEDIKDGERFVAAGRAMAAAGKPVFAYSMVRSDQGRQAALSHTGAMVGSFASREAVLRAAGVVSVASLRELEDAALLASSGPLPAGDRLVAVTFSGGACSIIADEAEHTPVRLPELSAATREAVSSHVPSYSAVRNPFDLSYQMLTRDDDFERVITALAAKEEYDAVLVQFTTNADPYAARLAERVVALRERLKIPLYVSRYGGEHLAPKALATYAEHGVPVLDAPDRALRAIANLVRSRQAQR